MTKMKRILCLLLVITMSASVFVGCTTDDDATDTPNTLVDMNTTDPITITYAYWEDQQIQTELAKAFMEKYTNITIDVESYYFESADGYTAALNNLAAVGELPDVFWILQPDIAIENGWLGDMTGLWENDPDARNTLKSLDEYKIGYFQTDQKWTTPVKYFPSVAYANKNLFDRKGITMPDVDMTWEEFEKSVTDMSMTDDDGYRIWGISEACTVITWYPVAANKDCIGEFGWNGQEFDMEDWAYGVNLEAKWVNKFDYDNSIKAPAIWEDNVAYFESEVWAQDRGNAAYRLDQWWCWERFWITDTFINDYKVHWVPYVMPHTEANQDSKNMMSVMDFGSVSGFCKNKREAYEWLKFSTWGQDGWKAKLEIFPTLYTGEEEERRLLERNNMPICTDQEIWDGFREWHPGEDDELERGKWFDYLIPYCQEAYALPYGAQQIPGFDTWLEQTGYRETETEIIADQLNALEYVESFEAKGKEVNQEYLEKLRSTLSAN